MISLILAQRTEDTGARVDAIDIDEESVAECRSNFEDSPWSDRLSADIIDFNTLLSAGEQLQTGYKPQYDMIVSNPPYFDAGVDFPESRREIARHCGELCPEVLVRRSAQILKPGGVLSIIVPADQADHLEKTGEVSGMKLEQKIWIKGHDSAPVKRAVLTFNKCSRSVKIIEGVLTLEHVPGEPTEEYKALGHPFYLNF